jgi:hypothetical protein
MANFLSVGISSIGTVIDITLVCRPGLFFDIALIILHMENPIQDKYYETKVIDAVAD